MHSQIPGLVRLLPELDQLVIIQHLMNSIADEAQVQPTVFSSPPQQDAVSQHHQEHKTASYFGSDWLRVTCEDLARTDALVPVTLFRRLLLVVVDRFRPARTPGWRLRLDDCFLGLSTPVTIPPSLGSGAEGIENFRPRAALRRTGRGNWSWSSARGLGDFSGFRLCTWGWGGLCVRGLGGL